MDSPGSARPPQHADVPVGDLSATQDRGVDVALNLIVATAAITVRDADGVSITLGRADDFATVAASDQKVYSMDGDQYALGQGPCLSAAADRQRYHVETMGEETRWPLFSARATERGISAILSTPLHLGDPDQGALNIYAVRPFAFSGVDRVTASVFAAQASAVLQAGALGDASGPALGLGLQSVLEQRELVAFRRALVAWASVTGDPDAIDTQGSPPDPPP